MSLSLEEIGAIFCHNRYCAYCPFSLDFKPDKFTKNMGIRRCVDACGDSASQRSFLWFMERGGADIFLKEASESLGYRASVVDEIYNWCGYNPGVDFV